MIFFFVSPLYTVPHEDFNLYTPGWLYGINLSLFLHKILFTLSSTRNVTLHLNFCDSFFIFGPIFGIQAKVIVFFFSVAIIIVVDTTCFLFKVIPKIDVKDHIHFCKTYRSVYFRLQKFFTEDIGSSCKNMLWICW